VINARDAIGDSGGIAVEVASHPAPGTTRGSAGSSELVSITVRDNGKGMAPDVLSRAREPFFTTKKSGEGTGLGLAMVSAFVRSSGGSFSLESEPGVGTTATMSFPKVAAGPARSDATPRQTIDFRMHGHATVLVVDDDAMVRAVVVEYLEELGYTVIQAEDALQALEVIASTVPIALVLSDVAMPGFDGASLAAQTRKTRPDLPILFMTGHADRLKLVGESVIDKPFTLAELALRIQQILGRARPPAAKLAARIKHPAMRALHGVWSEQVLGETLPSVESLELATCAEPDHVFVGEVVSLEPFSLRRVLVGSALHAYIAFEASDTLVTADDDDVFGGMEAAYRRSVRLRQASYEYMRFKREDGRSVVFERLLLPCADASNSSHQLVGMVIFDNLRD
jgi:CheY-like chemotaxis protein